MSKLKSMKMNPETEELVEELKKNYLVSGGLKLVVVTVFADLKSGH